VERAALRAQTLGMLFQSGNLLDHLSVEQNLVIAQRLAGHVDRERIASLLDDVGLSDRASAKPSSLSGGEAARAGLAVALANQPVLILADEPTGELDEVTAQRIMDLLRRHAQSGSAVLIVTHNADIAAAADREISLYDGQVV
jgi:putative ABC transport system ATP-binding protein